MHERPARSRPTHQVHVHRIVGSTGTSDFTALGDREHRAYLTSQGATGESLVTVQSAAAASLPGSGSEQRFLSLEGHPVDALALTMATA